jgi:acetoacetyl-CoA reductase
VSAGASSPRRLALVTGGLGGIGRATCERLADEGLRVIAADLAPEPGRLQDLLAAAGARDIRFEAVDVADPDSCEALAARLAARGEAVDVLVNAAGITRDVTLRKMELAQWREVMQVNLDGVFHLCRLFVGGMCERGHGRIVNLGSIVGQTGAFGQSNYAAAKAGLHGFGMALAREVAARGVTVNTISPGYVDTPMTRAIPDAVRERIVASIPAGRIGQPADIARAVAFLCADDAGYLTGINLPVNGGLFMAG